MFRGNPDIESPFRALLQSVKSWRAGPVNHSGSLSMGDASGSRIETARPGPCGDASTCRVPPCRRQIERTMARPSPEPGNGCVAGPEKALAGAGPLFGRHARAVVQHGQQGVVAVAADLHRDLPTTGRVAQRVVQHIRQGFFQQPRLGQYPQRIAVRGRVEAQINPAGAGVGPAVAGIVFGQVRTGSPARGLQHWRCRRAPVPASGWSGARFRPVAP